MSGYRHFAAFRKTVHEAAEEWPQSRQATRKPCEEEFLRYNSASKALLADVERKNPLKGKEMVKDPVPHGTRLMFRYCHIASLVARQDGASVDELVDVLRKPGSFSALDTLLNQNMDMAFFSETALGFIPSDGPFRPIYQDKWTIEDGTLQAPTIDHITSKAKHKLTEIGFRLTDATCPAHKAQIVKPIFQDIVTICERDKNLFERSLTKE